VPGHPVEDVRLADIQLHSRGGADSAAARREVPEMPDDYPEPMLFGMLPSWGIYVRHATGVRMHDIALHLLAADRRPAITLDDVLTGVEKEIEFTRQDTCDTCSGTGGKPGTEPTACVTCGGAGQVQQAGLGGMFRMVSTCPACNGSNSGPGEPCVAQGEPTHSAAASASHRAGRAGTGRCARNATRFTPPL